MKLVPEGMGLVGFVNAKFEVPISRVDLEQEYCRCTSQPYPIVEMPFARSWMLFKVCSQLATLIEDALTTCMF